MKIGNLKRHYTIENTKQWYEYQAKINKKTKEYLDIIISGSRKELILRFTGEKIKKIGYGDKPSFLISSVFNNNIVETNYCYVFEHVRSQLIEHDNESILNDPVILM